MSNEARARMVLRGKPDLKRNMNVNNTGLMVVVEFQLNP